MSWEGMNLFDINTSQITAVVPEQPVTLYLYDGDSVDDAGNTSITYTTVSGIFAQVQLETNQDLVHRDQYQNTEIKKRFYINSKTLSGLNRNLDEGGDYIYMVKFNLYYKISEVKQNFETGYVCVVGIETTAIGV